MIYHILTSNVYTDRFIQFMRKNHESIIGEHHFVFSTQKSYDGFDKKDCSCIAGLGGLLRLFLFSQKKDRFILHGYMHPWLYLVCFLTFWNLKKMTWMIWGGDLHFYNNPKKKIKYRIYELFRKYTIKRFKYIAGVKGDYELAQKYYNVRGSYIGVNYPQITLCDNIVRTRNESLYILVGNSGDSSNEHLEILKMLTKYRNEKICLFTPLSYGATEEYKRTVIEYGMNNFGVKFIPMNTQLSYDEYTTFLRSIDVMVCFHNRQQALGNILQLLEFGRKVFIRKGISTIDFLDCNEIVYELTDLIPELNFDEFCNLNEYDRKKNHEIISYIYSEEEYCKSWNFLFSSTLCV